MMRHLVSIPIILSAIAIMAVPAISEVTNVSDNVGGTYEISEFQVGVKAFTDRDHIIKEIPEKYLGATYIGCPVSSVRGAPDTDIKVEIDASSQVYILWYKQGEWAKPHEPSDWLLKDYEEMKEDTVIWGPDGGQGYNFVPWKSKAILPPGEFHTFITGNDVAYGIFVIEADTSSAVNAVGRTAALWGKIKSF